MCCASLQHGFARWTFVDGAPCSSALPSTRASYYQWRPQAKETWRFVASAFVSKVLSLIDAFTSGYQDSGSDIAFNLNSCEDVHVICPITDPKPESDSGWCFPDTEDGILEALEKGASHLWANTILFASHPLQTSTRIGSFKDRVRVVGHGPLVVEKYDDKELVNNLLRRDGRFTMPRSWSLHESPTLEQDIQSQGVQFPVVAKPIRGRGSHGVRVCHSLDELVAHARSLFAESPAIMLEEFLAGEEATVTVMPPTPGNSNYWSLPVVTIFNHIDGIAPYNGVVAVTANSRVISAAEQGNSTYAEVARECEQAAQLLGVTAPIRVDVRRFKDSPDSRFALFDLNMKPVGCSFHPFASLICSI